MKTFSIIRIKMVVLVVQSRYFFYWAGKKSVVSVVFAPSSDFLVLKQSRKWARLRLNMTCVTEKLKKTKQI